MNDRSHGLRLVVMVGVVLAVAFISWSAPIMSAPKITGEVMSLAKINRVNLVMIMGLDTLGLDSKEIHKQWSKRLAAQGIKVVAKGDTSAVTLNVVLVVLEDATVPNARGCIVFVIVEQPVTIDRINQKVVIPTYTAYAARLKTSDKLTKAAREAMDELLDKFLQRVRLTMSLQ